MRGPGVLQQHGWALHRLRSVSFFYLQLMSPFTSAAYAGGTGAQLLKIGMGPLICQIIDGTN